MGPGPEYQFEWDPTKARTNRSKHGVGFELAATVFLDRLAVSVFDEEHSETEERWITMGESVDGDVMVVAHTFIDLGANQFRVRIFSARRASRRERVAYESGR